MDLIERAFLPAVNFCQLENVNIVRLVPYMLFFCVEMIRGGDLNDAWSVGENYCVGKLIFIVGFGFSKPCFDREGICFEIFF